MVPLRRIKFYTKDGCHLCEEAWKMFTVVAGEFSFAITQVDITTDPQVYERFKYTIPVVEVDGEAVIGGLFSMDDLREALASSEARQVDPD
ncbi:MAG: glutaredoxin family protein [Dehalococcoidia bacterium]|nr:glutaredoxin family protein [Dehalococcoidia bacterium]